ncbi:MAG TPA: SpoIIE family protein phosphatase [Candidatus Baltobacteraceae bacterium]|jgi:PAS domain S-box-containing protein
MQKRRVTPGENLGAELDVGFRMIAEAMPQLVWSATADGVIDYLNQRWIDYTGVTLHDYTLEDRAALGIVHANELEATWERWKRALATGEPYEIEHRIKRGSDGTYRWFLERAVPVTDARGHIARWIGTATDIDEQRRSRDRLDFVVEAGNALASTLDVYAVCDALARVTIERFADWCFVVLREDGAAKTVAIAHKDKRLVRYVKEFRDRSASGPDEQLDAVLAQRSGYVVERLLPEQLEAAARDERHLEVLKRLQIHSLMVVPLVTDHNAYGAITMVSSESGRVFSATDLEIATSVAKRAGIALENSTAFERERRTAQTLRFIGRVNQLLFESSDVGATFERLARMVAAEVADACTIVRLEGDAVRVACAAHRDPTKNAIVGEMRGKRTLRPEAEAELATSLRKHQSIVRHPDDIEAVRARAWPYLSPQIEATDPKTTVIVPLYSAPATYGALIVYYSERSFDRDRDCALHEEIAARLSVALARAETFERERRIATTLQQASLPSLIPKPQGMRLDAAYLPAGDEAEVGGDWYDVVELDDGSVVVSVGDVTGHGIEAAAIMSKVRHAMGIVPKHVSDPTKILDSAEWFLRKRYPEAIVTAFVGIVSPDRKTIRYANAGHPWPYLRHRNGGLSQLACGGLPLGIRHAHEPAASQTIELDAGDALVLYTDGLVEWNQDVLEGEASLERLLTSEAIVASVAPAKLVARTCLPSKPRDDVAVLTVVLGETPVWSFATEDARAAADARLHFVQFLQTRTDDPDCIAQAELVFGELLGNVVSHAPGPVETQLFWTGGHAVLHVIDTGTAFDVQAHLPIDILSERGRGLFIVRQLARSVRVEHIFNCGNHIRVEL